MTKNLFDLLRHGVLGRNGSCVADDAPDDLVDSDLRLKTNVARIGTTALGLPLYSFSYKGQDEIYSGVMAQDVLDVAPHAVSTGSDGFYRVNYSALGIRMERLA